MVVRWWHRRLVVMLLCPRVLFPHHRPLAHSRGDGVPSVIGELVWDGPGRAVFVTEGEPFLGDIVVCSRGGRVTSSQVTVSWRVTHMNRYPQLTDFCGSRPLVGPC